jgi:hypothetical protein
VTDYPDRKVTELEAKAKEFGRIFKRGMPPGMGFALMLFDLGPSGWMTYISSANRADMIRAMREFILKLEMGAEDRPQFPSG